MACRTAYERKAQNRGKPANENPTMPSEVKTAQSVDQLIFGVTSQAPANRILQNNLTLFEWAKRNKIAPIYWGRYLNGITPICKSEIDFLHQKACKIALLYLAEGETMTKEQGQAHGEQALELTFALDVLPVAIFLEIPKENKLHRDYLLGYASVLLKNGFTPGFKGNTDATYPFDREFSRGLQTDKDVFRHCLVWAEAPSLAEYERITTSHLIHPDLWTPYAPSGITRRDIAIWQYGRDCHPIEDEKEQETTFQTNLIRNEQVIIQKMF